MRYRYTLPSLSLALCLAVPVSAQDSMAEPPPPETTTAAPMPGAEAAPPPEAPAAPSDAAPTGPTPAHTLSMAEWPAEKRAAYDSWPSDVQAYYWSLSEPRQGLFWRLTNDDKVKLAAIPPASQPEAWDNIEKVAAQPQGESSAQSDDKPQGPGR